MAACVVSPSLVTDALFEFYAEVLEALEIKIVIAWLNTTWFHSRSLPLQDCAPAGKEGTTV
ncbi:hypothetical protein SCLCIDRAFT_1213448 [Scleroderma citrinum Foug A]|uniref:Uncharacterized protein n=1 Tax=Scleroderma citrinum Foug A TaxID=1036808 RepID=A0A0C3E8M5_9AGAM|nr:hypothetical protein SCLCIDRAFT_1213448 [Scleroderma citrinum Foug A]